MEESRPSGKRSATEGDIVPSQRLRQVSTDRAAVQLDANTAAISNVDNAISSDSSDEGSTTASESVPRSVSQRHVVWLKPTIRREPRVGADFQAELPEIEG